MPDKKLTYADKWNGPMASNVWYGDDGYHKCGLVGTEQVREAQTLTHLGSEVWR